MYVLLLMYIYTHISISISISIYMDISMYYVYGNDVIYSQFLVHVRMLHITYYILHFTY